MKLLSLALPIMVLVVAPRRGAWIETLIRLYFPIVRSGRTPQGCVD